MNKDKQRIAIAEACGWKTELCDGDHQRCQNGMCYPNRFCNEVIPVWWIENSERYPGVYANPPDYLNDLNAMHEAEKVLALKDRRNHALWLADKCGDLGCIYATAAQRAEAFLRTLGKWEEEP